MCHCDRHFSREPTNFELRPLQWAALVVSTIGAAGEHAWSIFSQGVGDAAPQAICIVSPAKRARPGTLTPGLSHKSATSGLAKNKHTPCSANLESERAYLLDPVDVMMS